MSAACYWPTTTPPRETSSSVWPARLLDQGHTLAAAVRIQDLEDDLAAERALTARLHEQLGERGGQGG